MFQYLQELFHMQCIVHTVVSESGNKKRNHINGQKKSYKTCSRSRSSCRCVSCILSLPFLRYRITTIQQLEKYKRENLLTSKNDGIKLS